MTTELTAALVTLALSLAGLAKVWTELAKVKASRLETKESRDTAEREIRDMLLKHDFAITQLKDSQALTATVVDDLRDTCAALNTGVAKLDLAVANLTEAIREMKR